MYVIVIQSLHASLSEHHKLCQVCVKFVLFPIMLLSNLNYYLYCWLCVELLMVCHLFL